jgi:hypothetical protein
VRLNFTYPPANRIAEGVSRFAAALRDVVDEPRTAVRVFAGTRPIV